MPTLVQHRLDPGSRLIRLMLSEYGVAVELVDTKPWLREPTLVDIDPAATVPVLLNPPDPPIIGTLACLHEVEEGLGAHSAEALVPVDPAARAEMWRLLEWVLGRFNDEVTRYVIEEKVAKRDQRGKALDTTALRAGKANLKEHLQYFGYLLATRAWLAGDAMTLADFALAAHLSCLDYLGDVPWDTAGETRDWYARLKSRPAFRTLLGDKLLGITPHTGYADLDF